MGSGPANILNAIGSYFKNLGLSLIGQLKSSVASFLNDFVTNDLGAIAVDAVSYASTLTDKSAIDKREAAKAKFLTDAKTAGHDVEAFGESILNFLIETAYQSILAASSQGIVAVKG